MKVKICGITNLADARYASAAGSDYLGFVQYSGSRRYVAPSTAAEIIGWISGPQSVGVFVDEDPIKVNEMAEAANFDLVQLHGTESVQTCSQIGQPIIKAFSVRDSDTVESVRARMNPFGGVAAFFLLDAYDPDVRGGTGKTIDWTIVRELASEFPLFLAGGLTPANVVEAAKSTQPMGVDISSGLEFEPGVKDFTRIDTFFGVLRDNLLIGVQP